MFSVSQNRNWSKVCGCKFNTYHMHTYQQLDLQALIDLLATETQEYTRAFSRGEQEEVAVRRIVMEALIAEIKSRKKEDILPQNALSAIAPPETPQQG
jgi:hypothetical protein